MAINAAQLAKFRRRAPFIQTQSHLDRAMFSFPSEHHAEIAAQIQPLLTKEIMARPVDALPTIQFKNPENPTPDELTAKRLNNLAANVEQLKATLQPVMDENATLKAQVETHEATIAALVEEREQVKAVNISLTAAATGEITADSMKR